MNTTATVFSLEHNMDITDFMAIVALFTWTLGCLLFMTAKGNHGRQTNPEQIQEQEQEQEQEITTNNWKSIGIYHLNKPQTLSKAEREALATVDGNAAYLYERTHKSGAKSWRYAIGDTWFYPTESAVKRRGMDLFGNNTLVVE